MSRTKAKTPREELSRLSRIVVKIGSSSLAAGNDATARLASSVAALRKANKSVVLVSSGAIALGFRKLGYATRPKEVAKLQASAAAGQSLAHAGVRGGLRRAGSAPCAQVLLTHSDVAERTRANNARAALAELLAVGAVPILNENDSVAVEEIKFGDNDQLAAMVTPLVDGRALDPALRRPRRARPRRETRLDGARREGDPPLLAQVEEQRGHRRDGQQGRGGAACFAGRRARRDRRRERRRADRGHRPR